MNLKEIQDELLALAARSVTLANELGKITGKIEELRYVEVTWKQLQAGDVVRVTYVDGTVADESVYIVEHGEYSGYMPFAVESKGWLTSVLNYSDPEETYVKLEKQVKLL